MASEPEKRDRDLSAEEKLRAADRELAQLRDVLASMDEIDALRKRDGKPETGEYGGYKRADVSAMVAELERRRRELLAEIAAGGAQGGRDASAARERVTLSDALERLYAAISGNIERAKNEILREIRYSCRQDTAIYAELSARLDALADKVAEKVLAAGIDTDDLARRMVAHMTARSDAQTIEAMEKRIAELESALAARAQNMTDEKAADAFDDSAEEAAEAETAATEAPQAEEEAAEEEQPANAQVLPEEGQPANAQVLPEEEQPMDAQVLPEEEQPADEEVLPEEEQPMDAQVLPEEEQPMDAQALPEENTAAAEDFSEKGENVTEDPAREVPEGDAAEGAEVDEKHTGEAEPRAQTAEGESSEK